MPQPGRKESMDVLAWALATSYQFEQLAYVLESNPQCLGVAHQPQVCQGLLTVQAIAVRKTTRPRQDPAFLVIAQCRRA
jgi:hypothetical protein